MAIAVMAVIILLNIALLLAVMRLGTMEDFHSEVAAEDSAAVLAWRARLAARAETDSSAADATDGESA
ncbi:MAG: hypothetical protein OXG78_00600 [Chloroflexi bacterium]|nr:hypothetical protein [Chloroflexota bacterium]